MTRLNAEPRVLDTARVRWIPLTFAALCISDETVFDLRAEQCPTCTSRAFVLLANWLKERK